MIGIRMYPLPMFFSCLEHLYSQRTLQTGAPSSMVPLTLNSVGCAGENGVR